MQPTTSESQDRNQSVDTFRLLAALSVIILHLEYPALPSGIVIGVRLLGRWAIPFFFIISGYYFAARNVDEKRWDVQKIIERLILIFLLWNLIYAPVVIDQHGVTALLKRIFAISFIYFGDFFHLWYIGALGYGYLFVAFCFNFNLKHWLPWFSLIIIVLALISTPYSPAIDLGFRPEYDLAYWISIPFLYIGSLFFTRRYPSWWVSLMLIVLGAALQIMEARFLYQQYGSSAYEHEFLIGTIPLAIGMAGLALNNLKWTQLPLLAAWGREYSLGIYLIHLLVIHIFAKMIRATVPSVASNLIWQGMLPLVILGLCLLVLASIRRFVPGIFNLLNGRPA